MKVGAPPAGPPSSLGCRPQAREWGQSAQQPSRCKKYFPELLLFLLLLLLFLVLPEVVKTPSEMHGFHGGGGQWLLKVVHGQST